MTIIGITGDIGAGKSLQQLKHGLKWCEDRKKRLVTNFGVDKKQLKKYAAMAGLPWVAWLADNDQIAVIDTMTSIEDLLVHPNSVVLMDEAGIFLNSRNFAKTPQSLLMDLAQSRKMGVDLLYCSQFDGQVDKQFRMLTQHFVHAAGMSKFCPKLRIPKLVWKQYWHFTASSYWSWVDNHKARRNIFRTWLLANHYEYGPVTPADLQLFKVFDTKARLEKQSEAAVRFGSPDMTLASSIKDSRLASQDRRHLQRMKDDTNYLLSQDLSEVMRFIKRRKSLV